MLRFGHETNGDRYPWCSYVNGQTPASFIDTFRYVHDPVTAIGATNVIWDWCPNHSGQDDPSCITASYPGDAYVDWTGVDFYNWGTSQPWSRWEPAADLLRTAYDRIRRVAPERPLMIDEMGCSPVGGDKAAWISALWPTLKTDYPNVRALVWFNIDKETDWLSSHAAKPGASAPSLPASRAGWGSLGRL
jgi:beta-mannanase